MSGILDLIPLASEDPSFRSSFTNWGSLASIVGLAVGLVATGAAIWAAIRASGAREAASAAKTAFRQGIARLQFVSDMSAVVGSLNELMLLHREGRWELALDRYATVRQSLSAIRQAFSGLSEAARTEMQDTIAHLRTCQGKLEANREEGLTEREVVRANKVIARQADSLAGILQAEKLET